MKQPLFAPLLTASAGHTLVLKMWETTDLSYSSTVFYTGPSAGIVPRTLDLTDTSMIKHDFSRYINMGDN